MKHHIQITVRLLFFSAMFLAAALINYGQNDPSRRSGNNLRQTKQLAEDCSPSYAYAELNINNVRARINAGGDLWWDLQGNAQYFIPKNTLKCSLFSGALWIGGLDDNGNLKLAAQMYRGGGVDFFTGPLTADGTASTDASICSQWDRLFEIKKSEVKDFIAEYAVNPSLAGYSVPHSITDYPAHGDVSKNQSFYLAPFFDNDGDGMYNYKKGDYPYYDFDNALCLKNLPPGYPITTTMEGNGILADQVLKGDQTLWWVFNDKGNVHGESGGAAIGLEIRAQAFAFATNDEINNMTFYSYEIINRSTSRLNQTYFGQFVDCDLGYAWDDYVGCDVLRGLGYCYNGTDIDGNGEPQAYGAQPPAVGVDFIQGPYMDKDGLDDPAYNINTPTVNCGQAINGQNFGDGIIDNERLGIRFFVSCGGGLGLFSPGTAHEYYNLLHGLCTDDHPMTYWGNGHPSYGGSGPECTFMFPANSDPCNWGTNGANPGPPFPAAYWNEPQAGNAPFDRRFMESSGPFTLEPGAVNYVMIGVPWARATSGGAWASVQLLQLVDDKCQKVFDNCFKILDGPDAPDVTLQELDRELILYISNRRFISNNYNNIPEDYAQIDPSIVFPDALPASQRGDSAYRFEGYQIFQVKDATVTADELHDPDKARLVAQCDIKNGVGKIINSYYNAEMNRDIPVEEVNGADAGIVHSFRIFEDKFASGDTRLVNFKKYYYMAIAYAYNNFKTFDPYNPLALDGQKLPYKAGIRSSSGPIMIQSGMPHIVSPEAAGTILHSEYGTQPMITRIEGQGNGGLDLDLTQASVDNIMANGFAGEIQYNYNSGPVNIKVIDPLNVVAANYTLKFDPPGNGDINKSKWTLASDRGQTWSSERSIEVGYEQLLMDIGLSMQIQQVAFPGQNGSVNMGFIEATIQFADSSKKWLNGIMDEDAIPDLNWIRSGSKDVPTDFTQDDYYMDTIESGQLEKIWLDPTEVYEKLLHGTWSPYVLASMETNGPGLNNSPYPGPFGLTITNRKDFLNKIASVDLYITSDKSKWSRSPVFEECEDVNSALAEGNRKKLNLRAGATVGLADTLETGMGWFPGYAINVETGERLNIGFGEDSWLQGENGRDMIWNPTGNLFTNLGDALLGGKHWIYIFGHYRDSINTVYGRIDCPAYDGGQWIRGKLNIPYTSMNFAKNIQFVFKDAMWVGGPLLTPGYSFNDPANIPCNVKIRLRIAKPYQRYYSTKGTGPAVPADNNYPLYTFGTADIATETHVAMAAEGSVDLINIVPNPYYAYSEYETGELDGRVRITNLPPKCIITIYAINGKLIRQFTKDDPLTYQDWDLKNNGGNPVASGIYLIYIKIDGVGEKILKWFGAMHPRDLNSF